MKNVAGAQPFFFVSYAFRLATILKKNDHLRRIHTYIHACNQNQAPKDFFLVSGEGEEGGEGGEFGVTDR